MSQVYRMDAESNTVSLHELRCKNEEKDLQLLLEKNLALLPGDQIKGDTGEDLRWILIKREMPVVNAASGEQALWIDFLLADQYGIPTLVECKRHDDGRSRREVVAQMLKYAAGGYYYWEGPELLSHAQESAGGEEKLLEKLKELTLTATTPLDFFSKVKENLKQSKIRCIFFLEDSPKELTNLVEFVNGQMKDVELLIVEARQFELAPGGDKIIVPRVFGYTEEARVAKHESKAETLRSSGAGGEDAFWEGASSSFGGVESESFSKLKMVIESVTRIPECETKWAKTWMVNIPGVVPRETLFAIRRDGRLELYLSCWLPAKDEQLLDFQRSARDAFLAGIESITGAKAGEMLDKMTYRLFPAEKWMPKADQMVRLTKEVARFASIRP